MTVLKLRRLLWIMMPSNGCNKLKQNDKAILKMKRASVSFEHTNANFEQHLGEKLKSLDELIIRARYALV